MGLYFIFLFWWQGDSLASGSKRTMKTIDSFFNKKRKTNDNDQPVTPNTNTDMECATSTNASTISNLVSTDNADTNVPFLTSPTTDIGFHINYIGNLDDLTKEPHSWSDIGFLLQHTTSHSMLYVKKERIQGNLPKGLI